MPTFSPTFDDSWSAAPLAAGARQAWHPATYAGGRGSHRRQVACPARRQAEVAPGGPRQIRPGRWAQWDHDGPSRPRSPFQAYRVSNAPCRSTIRISKSSPKPTARAGARAWTTTRPPCRPRAPGATRAGLGAAGGRECRQPAGPPRPRPHARQRAGRQRRRGRESAPSAPARQSGRCRTPTRRRGGGHQRPHAGQCPTPGAGSPGRQPGGRPAGARCPGPPPPGLRPGHLPAGGEEAPNPSSGTCPPSQLAGCFAAGETGGQRPRPWSGVTPCETPRP